MLKSIFICTIIYINKIICNFLSWNRFTVCWYILLFVSKKKKNLTYNGTIYTDIIIGWISINKIYLWINVLIGN